MKILVTGSRGYIGQHLMKWLRGRGHITLGIDIIDGQDLLSCPLPPSIDCVVNLASLTGVRASWDDPHLYMRDNIEMATRIFNAYPDTPIIHASTGSVVELKSPYAYSKYAIERFAPDNVIIARLHTVWGHNIQDCYRKNMLYGMIQDGNIPNKLAGHWRDYTHIDDTCEALELIINNTETCLKHNDHIDIGYGKPCSNEQFLEHFRIDPHIFEWYMPEGESTSTCADPYFLQSILHWRPTLCLKSSSVF